MVTRRDDDPWRTAPPNNSGRRSFLQAAGAGAVLAAAGASAYVALGQRSEVMAEQESDAAAAATTTPQSSDGTDISADTAGELPIIEWDMPTSWPTSLPVLWGNSVLFAERVRELTADRFRITPHAAGEVASPIGILDVVNTGEFAVGSTASYYYIDKSPVLSFGTALPFGLTARQHNAWMHYGGGLERLQQFYIETFNVIQFPAGNTGAQMGGWFNRELSGLADLDGLKMRLPGLGGRVMERLGVEVVTLGAGDILASLQNGDVDAAEFIGPYDDSNLGLQESAGFYYYPGFWEPGASLDLMVNYDQWNSLPPLYQAAFRSAAFELTVRSTAEYDARNGQALNDLVAAGTQLREFPADVTEAAQAAAGLILDEIAATDPTFADVLSQWRDFRSQVRPWFSLAEAGSIS